MLGMQAYRVAFRRPGATIGEQADRLSEARLWLLPNPSGLQARYGLSDMVVMFTELRQAAGMNMSAEGRRP
jgi:TDG/mug DNA glycosylase family protein